MKKIKQPDYLPPFITLVILFFFVGFLTTVNGQFQGPLKTVYLSNAGELKNTFATLISFAWFMAYPLTGGLGASWVTRYGYKRTLIQGLLILIAGLGIFWLSSAYTIEFPESCFAIGSAVIPWGYVIFLLGSYVVGAASTVLQVVINPYLTACKVKGTQPVQRLNIGGSVNSIGTTLAPFFVTGIVFGGISMEEVQIGQIQHSFLWLMGIFIFVTLVFTHMALPDIQDTKADQGNKLEKSVWSFSHLRLGVVAIFCYVGVEVCVGANINLYAMELEKGGREVLFLGKDALSIGDVHLAIPALMATLYWGGMLVGRLVSSVLNHITPRVQLGVAAALATLSITIAILLDNPWILVGVGLFHSVMWGAIFTLSVNQLGKYTSVASGVFMIGIIGGSLLPLCQGVFADLLGGVWRWTWFIVVVGEVYILYYALSGSQVKQSEEDTLH